MTKMEKQDLKRTVDAGENNIEFTRNSPTATVCFSQGRYVSKIKRLAEKYPDECKIMYENKDGSIVAHIPVSWVKVSPKRKISDEQREAATERMKQYQKHKKGKNNE